MGLDLETVRIEVEKQVGSGPETKMVGTKPDFRLARIVRPAESRVDTQPQLQPALLRLSAMISQYFTEWDCASLIFSLSNHFRPGCFPRKGA
jgi:hypothetical protein